MAAAAVTAELWLGGVCAIGHSSSFCGRSCEVLKKPDRESSSCCGEAARCEPCEGGAQLHKLSVSLACSCRSWTNSWSDSDRSEAHEGLRGADRVKEVAEGSKVNKWSSSSSSALSLGTVCGSEVCTPSRESWTEPCSASHSSSSLKSSIGEDIVVESRSACSRCLRRRRPRLLKCTLCGFQMARDPSFLSPRLKKLVAQILPPSVSRRVSLREAAALRSRRSWWRFARPGAESEVLFFCLFDLTLSFCSHISTTRPQSWLMLMLMLLPSRRHIWCSTSIHLDPPPRARAQAESPKTPFRP